MDIFLSTEQIRIFKIMEKTLEHMFITGYAGTGKSILLRYFQENTKKRAGITAPTGIAALNVRGQTIHSFFGLAPRLHTKGKITLTPRVRKRLEWLEVLIIDEVSMLRADLLDAIDEALRLAKKNDLPFGGVQIIMFGDPYQLPPIVEKDLVKYFETVYEGPFFFHAHVWKKTDFQLYELTQIFRQKDADFKDILNAIRDGSATDDHLELLNTRYGVTPSDEGTIILAPTNALVTEINQQKLDQLPGDLHTYKAILSGTMRQTTFPTEEILQLKVGAQIILLRNDREGRWVNGSVGKVVRLFEDSLEVFVDGNVYTLERETWEEIAYEYDPDTGQVEEKVVASFSQLPVRLASALTIHKSQGQTYEDVAIDLSAATFAPGQLYVALSRCKSLYGVYLKKRIKHKHIMVDPRIRAFMKKKKNHKKEYNPRVIY